MPLFLYTRLLLAVSALNDELVGSRLVIARLKTQCGLAPRSQRAGMSDGGLTFTTTMRVIAGVHYGTADGGTDAHVTLAASLTDVHVLVIQVADLTDCCLTVKADKSYLTGGKSYLSFTPVRALSSFVLQVLQHS